LRRTAGDHVRVRTVGVEEELLLVNASGRPVSAGPAVLARAARRGVGETVAEHDEAVQQEQERPAAGDRGGIPEPVPQLVAELKEEQVELGTRVCRELDEVAEELRYWRSEADSAAAATGVRVAALATSPLPVEPAPTVGDRFDRLHDRFGLTADEQLTCGCHVHVQVADDDEGVAVLDRIRVWLPVLTALTANSPFWLGRDTRYQSFRSQAWTRWPSAGPSGPYGSAAAYHRLTAELLATDTLLDEGMVYFDARLSARWPTVEVRVGDVCLRVADAVVLAGLVRGLVDTAAARWRAGEPAPEVRTEVLRLAGWRAGRSGLTGDLVDPRTGRPAPAAAVLAGLLDHVRPALDAAGDLDRVERGVADLLRRGTGSTLQLAVFAGTGDLGAVVRAAVEATHER